MEIGAKRRLERKARPRSGTPKSVAPGSARPTVIGAGITTIMVAVGIRTIVVTTGVVIGTGIIGVVAVTRRAASAVVRTW